MSFFRRVLLLTLSPASRTSVSCTKQPPSEEKCDEKGFDSKFVRTDWLSSIDEHAHFELTTVNIYTKSKRKCSNKYTFDASLFCLFGALWLCAVRSVPTDHNGSVWAFFYCANTKVGLQQNFFSWVAFNYVAFVSLIFVRVSMELRCRQSERLWTLLKRMKGAWWGAREGVIGWLSRRLNICVRVSSYIKSYTLNTHSHTHTCRLLDTKLCYTKRWKQFTPMCITLRAQTVGCKCEMCSECSMDRNGFVREGGRLLFIIKGFCVPIPREISRINGNTIKQSHLMNDTSTSRDTGS